MNILKLNKDSFNTISENIEKFLGVNNVQLYNPILSHYFKFYNNDSYNMFTLKSPKFVCELHDKLTNKYEDSYIKNMFSCSLLDTKTQEIVNNREVFIKILPILDVLSYMKNDYRTENPNLPNIYNYLTNKKINNYHNSAYIDSYFTYLGSKLVDLNLCPTFPEYLGTFSGISKEFSFDVTEEYSDLSQMNWYKSGLDKKFRLERVKNKKLDDYFKEMDNLEFVENDGNSSGSTNFDSEDSDINTLDSLSDIENLEEFQNLNRSLNNSERRESRGSNDSNDSNDSSDSNVDTHSDNLSIDSFNSDMSFSDKLRYLYYVQVPNYPVQLVCLEKLDATVDNLIENGYTISDTEWKSILFQICFGLSVAQKNYEFVHNDLHSSNIMFKSTELSHLYFRYKNKYFKVPVFGKITKIIDFGRATFKVKNKLFFSDVFKKNGDAEGQYSFPYNNSLKDCKIRPNRSFDLSRLATTIIEHFSEDSQIYRLLKLWCTDKNGNNLLKFNDDFNLYKLIAKNVVSAVPVKQLEKKIFQEFLIKKEDIPENTRVYYY